MNKVIPFLMLICIPSYAEENPSLDQQEKILLQEAIDPAFTGDPERAGMLHGQMLEFADQKFFDKAAGVVYFMLRSNPKKPDCKASADFKPAAITRLPSMVVTCDDKHAVYGVINRHITPELIMFRAIEEDFFDKYVEHND